MSAGRFHFFFFFFLLLLLLLLLLVCFFEKVGIWQRAPPGGKRVA
jgi:hypothetical protein